MSWFHHHSVSSMFLEQKREMSARCLPPVRYTMVLLLRPESNFLPKLSIYRPLPNCASVAALSPLGDSEMFFPPPPQTCSAWFPSHQRWRACLVITANLFCGSALTRGHDALIIPSATIVLWGSLSLNPSCSSSLLALDFWRFGLGSLMPYPSDSVFLLPL